MPTDITIAFAGHAKNRQSNIESLLSDWLRLGAPDREGYYDKPDHLGKITVYALLTEETVPPGLEPALRMALSIDGAECHLVTDHADGDIVPWAECVDKAHEVEDPIAYLIGRLAAGDRPHLFMNWDEEDADDEQLINLAHEHTQIKVSDLVSGLAAILPDDAGEEEAVEEQEPVKEEKAPRRKRASRELEEKPEDLEEPPATKREKSQASAPSTLEEEVAAAKRATDAPAQVTISTGSIPVPADILRGMRRCVGQASSCLQALDNFYARKNLADEVKNSPLTASLLRLEDDLNTLLHSEQPYEETLPKDKPKMKAAAKDRRVIWDEEAGEWKTAGRGRPRAGARTGRMDASGVVTED